MVPLGELWHPTYWKAKYCNILAGRSRQRFRYWLAPLTWGIDTVENGDPINCYPKRNSDSRYQCDKIWLLGPHLKPYRSSDPLYCTNLYMRFAKIVFFSRPVKIHFMDRHLEIFMWCEQCFFFLDGARTHFAFWPNKAFLYLARFIAVAKGCHLLVFIFILLFV